MAEIDFYEGRYDGKQIDALLDIIPSPSKQMSWDAANNWVKSNGSGLLNDRHMHSNYALLESLTNLQVTNWNAAFGWGNHASAGYSRIYTANEPIADYAVEISSINSVDDIAFDKAQKKLLGVKVALPFKYYDLFDSDPRGMSKSDYETNGVCIVAGNDIFKYEGAEWKQIFALNFDPNELIPKEKQDKWDDAYTFSLMSSNWIADVMYDGKEVWSACNWVLTNSKAAQELINKKQDILNKVNWVTTLRDAFDTAGYEDLSDLIDFLSETPDRIAYLYDLSQYKDLALIKQLTTESNNIANAASQKVDGYEARVQEVYTAYREGRLKGGKGDKGDQGNSGYTGAAGELEVVNNLTQGGATAALSAEMGKYLYEHSNYDIIYEWDWERMTEAEQAAYVREHPNLVVLEGRNPESGGSYIENGTLYLDGSFDNGKVTLYSATFSNGTLTL